MATETMEERKDRLEALRQAADLSIASDNEDGGGQVGGDEAEEPWDACPGGGGNREPAIRFRNYVPRDDKLREFKVAPPPILKFDDPVARDPVDANETVDPIVSIAPKKANWDLRRDVAKKLEKLERRTQRAIIQLMQEEEKRRQTASPEADDMS